MSHSGGNSRIDNHGMNDTAHRHGHDDGKERKKYLRTVLYDHGKKKAEYADRSKAHNHSDDFVAHLSTRIKDIDKKCPLFSADRNNACPDKKSKYDDR